MAFYLVTVAVLFSAPGASANVVIRYHAPIEQNDTQKDYFIILLKQVCKTLQEENTHCKLTPIGLPMRQQKQLDSLNSGLIDIVWTVTTKERETNYLPIRIPLMNGLMGYRIAVANKRHRSVFTKNYDLNDLRTLRLAQGKDWPDTPILKANGFNVIGFSRYEKLYRDTSSGLYDYTLRGVLEVYSEFEKFKQPNVFIDQNLLFKYPSAIYFFVKKDNQMLANQISKALTQLKQTGEFDKIFSEFKNHKLALNQAELEKRITIELVNNNITIPTLIEKQN